MPDFTHLHSHTGYSMLDGAMSPDQYVDAVKGMGMDACAITDHGYLYGLPEFQRACQAKGVKPILGVEAYFVDSVARVREAKDRQRFHQLLIAKSEEGVRNLYRLMSWASTEGFYSKPLIDFEQLKKHSEGLIATSTCLQGIIPKILIGGTPDMENASRAVRLDRALEVARWFKDVFGDDYYIEVHRHGIEDEERMLEALPLVAQKLDIKIVSANDCHYVEETDFEFQDAICCVGTKGYLADKSRFQIAHANLNLKTPQQMVDLLPEFPLAPDVTMEIADKIDANALIQFGGKDGNYLFPDFPLPPQFSDPHRYLTHQCAKRFQQLYPEADQETKDRVRFELAMIKQMGFSQYFLIVADIVQGAKDLGIAVGPGRGSAAGSIVAYLLGITGIDPIKYDLLFERFLNPSRVSMPDIDIDFADDRRGEVIDYIVERYGADHTSQVCNVMGMKARRAIQDFGRVLGLPKTQTLAITKKFPDDAVLTGKPLSKIVEASPDVADEYAKAKDDPVLRKMFGWVEKAYNYPRNRGLHAAAILITPGPVEDYIPYQRKDDKWPKTGIVTQFDGNELDDLGLLKMDILGLSTLSVIERCIELVEASGRTVDRQEAGMTETATFDDPKVYDMLKRGDNVGVFQFDKPHVRRYLQSMLPDNFHDLIALNALNRPGPQEYIPSYVKRKHGRGEVSYPHPLVEDILEPTYGIIVYQEQAMRVTQQLAGFTLAEADNLRRAMGKKKLKDMEAMKPKFFDGARERGVTEDIAAGVWSDLLEFANYAFNKSHAAAYAAIAYQTAYLKAYYPVEFTAALIEKGDLDERPKILETVREQGFEVRQPHINKSDAGFSVEWDEQGGDGAIRFGLASIKGVGAEAEKIIKARNLGGPFTSFDNLIDRAIPRQNALQALIQAGALDELFNKDMPNRCTLFEAVKPLTGHYRKVHSYRSGKRKSDPARPEIDIKPEWPITLRLFHEREVTGAFVSGHPLDPVREFVDAVRRDADTSLSQNEYRFFVGAITDINRRKTKKGDPMWWVKIHDGVQEAELPLFESTYDRFGAHVEDQRTVFVVGKNGKGSFRGKYSVEVLLPIEQAMEEWTQCIHVSVRDAKGAEAAFKVFEDFAEEAKIVGDELHAEAWVTVKNEHQNTTLMARHVRTKPTRTLLEALRKTGRVTLAL